MRDVMVVVVGGSGFVGQAVCAALARRGASAVPLSAPRLAVSAGEDPRALVSTAVAALRPEFGRAAAVVNAAGIADAASADLAALDAANALLPMTIAMACAAEGTRLVHISSAAVQGRRNPLDSSAETAPLTAYARSKAEGERLVRQQHPDAVVYRPPGVHGASRSVTRSLARLAASPASSVASPGDGSAPHALIQDVADAAAFLALSPTAPPAVVHHPAAGLTTASLLRLLGDGREPRRVPRRVARVIVDAAGATGRLSTTAAAQARRLEVMWCGQEQAPSWLTAQGWQASTNDDDWRRLGQLVRHQDPAAPDTILPNRKSS